MKNDTGYIATEITFGIIIADGQPEYFRVDNFFYQEPGVIYTGLPPDLTVCPCVSIRAAAANSSSAPTGPISTRRNGIVSSPAPRRSSPGSARRSHPNDGKTTGLRLILRVIGVTPLGRSPCAAVRPGSRVWAARGA